jgi:hypothetical protein
MSIIAVNIIATNNYKQFLPQLLQGLNEYFLTAYQLNVHVFTDLVSSQQNFSDRMKIFFHQIPPYGWPQATLYRFKIMTSIKYTEDYIFYLDADMKICDYVNDEILGDFVVVRHPGYFNGGWGSKNVDKRSTAYLSPDQWGQYFAGGFSGGSREVYYKAMQSMKERIDEDEKNGVEAEWQDETHLNNYAVYNKPTVILDCSYCMAEAVHKRVAWGINHIKPKILALEKDKNIRI